MNHIAQKRFAVNPTPANLSTLNASYAASAIDAIASSQIEKAPFRACADMAIEAGWSPIPRRDDTKRPAIDKWQEYCQRQMRQDELVSIFANLPKAHISVACGYAGVIWIDQDTEKPEIIAAYRSIVPESSLARRGSKGRADAYRVIGEMPANRKFYGTNNKPFLEILSTGSNVIVPPSLHPDTGKPYEWLGDIAIYDTIPDELPTVTAEQLSRLEEVLKPWMRQQKAKPAERVTVSDPASITDQQRKRYQAMAEKTLDTNVGKLVSMKKGRRNDAMYRGVCACAVFVRHGFLSQDMVEDAFYAAASANGLLKENGEKDVRNTIADGLKFQDDLPVLIDRPLKASRAKQAPKPATVYSEPVPPSSPCGDLHKDEAEGIPANSEEGLALSFAGKHQGNLRYVAESCRWMHWTGKQWEEEKTLLAFDMARAHCREATQKATDAKEKAALCDAKTRANVLSLARTDRRLAATLDQWNSDDWLMNTPGGIIDLKTGQTIPHDPRRYMTKMTTVAPGGDAPKWRAFLDDVTAGDKELQAFLQRIAGYCLTGRTTEHALFFCHGKGGNGKGVFLNTITGILDAYHRPAPIETFTESKSDRHPTDLAGLVGARLVTASETEEGRPWAEAKIKQLTGGDPISARFMRGDFFDYMPKFKLFIVGNHKPQIRNVDDAMRRRFHLIPFTVTIPDEKKNPNLTEDLKAEWGGILQWMVEGCLEWQRVGLAAPASVKQATEDYMQAEDSLQTFLDDMTDRGAGKEYLADLFGAWKRWAAFNNIPEGSNKKFLAKLEDRGFEAGKDKKGKLIIGLSLRQSFVYTGLRDD
jgi:putative DNA primase/helicase